MVNVYRILIVDDTWWNVQVLMTIIEKLGIINAEMRFVSADDGTTGI